MVSELRSEAYDEAIVSENTKDNCYCLYETEEKTWDFKITIVLGDKTLPLQQGKQ